MQASRFSQPLLTLLTSFLVLTSASSARAQLLYSFETGLEGWAATGYTDSDFISVSTSTLGATVGTQSMAVETGPSYGWDVKVGILPTDATRYAAFNAVAANLSQYTLDFDISVTAESFASVSNPGNFFLINVAANSDAPNFPQTLNVSPNLNGLTGIYPISIPMSSLPVAQDSSFLRAQHWLK